ncbi:LysR family transcriptional regulator [Frisingicoccus sp.]|uniref:LysR family transcriptional regulator n=1 Tax=Frisingicoccus sp. TaxID=1918627 RepID=UPI003AB75DC1
MYNHYLKMFIQVADSGSFSKAAENNYITPTAVMKQINNLENHFGFALFNRSNRGLELTEAGKIIYKEAKDMISHSDAVIKYIEKTLKNSQNTIRIGNSFLFPCNPIISLWNHTENHASDIQLKIISLPSDADVYDVNNDIWNQIDLFFGNFAHPESGTPGFSHTWLEDKLLQCALPEQHPLAKKTKLSISDLYNENLMIVKRGISTYIDLLRNDLEQEHPQITLIDTPSYEFETLNQCLEQNCLMITIDNWNHLHPSLVNRPVEWNYTVPYGLIYLHDHPPIVDRFINDIKKIFSQS